MNRTELIREHPKLYHELASWWPLLSAPSDYAEEASFYHRLLTTACEVGTLLELGSGGGNNAFHLKRHFQLTLVDRSPVMLAVSQALNPDCEHVEGDMRTLRLGREFDGVFVHDAISYMTTTGDLRRALETAYLHCKPGGVALFAPDHVRENFRSSTSHGGHDGEDRGLRYLQWVWDPDPEDTIYTVDFAYLLRMEDGSTRVEHDRHIEGLFSREIWMRTLGNLGFEAERIPFEHSEFQTGELEVFFGKRPKG
ncbi:MAG: class I SAM-dependent methyltransferase [Gemmatimonadota bacterium]